MCTPVSMLTFVSHMPDEFTLQVLANFTLDNMHTPPTHTNFILESILHAVLHMHKHANLILDSFLNDVLHV